MPESWQPGSRYMNVSQLSAWLRCRYLWEKTYLVGIRPRHDRPYFSLGDLVHALLAAYLKRESPEEAHAKWKQQFYDFEAKGFHLTDEEWVVLEGVEHTAWAIFKRTVKEIDLGHRWEPMQDADGRPMVEYHFKVDRPVGNYDGFQGFIDWLALELDTGREWLTDWKVRGSLQPEDSEQFSLQMACYTKMLRVNGFNPVGSMAWQLKNSGFKEPKENKPGKHGERTLSRALIATDWDTYQRAVLAIGGNPADYEDMKAKLAEIEWSRQSRCFWSEQTVDNIWETEVIPATSEVGFGLFTRSISAMNCKTCSLQALCHGDLHGHDTNFLLETQYRLRGSEDMSLPVLEDDEPGSE